MAHWGATFTQVVEELQGADTSNTLAPNDYGGQSKIEEVMTQEMEIILGYVPIDAFKALTSGKFPCHKVIDNVQNTAQTLVDPGQGFPLTVDQDTFRIQLNSELIDTEEGLDNTNYSFAGNVLSVSTDKSRGDTFYSYYTGDPDTLSVPSLARLLIKMSAMVLMRREVIGGSGDDGGISDTADLMAAEIQESLTALQNTTSIAALFKLNLCENISGPNVAKLVTFCRSR